MSSRDILAMPAPEADFRLPYGSDPYQFGDLRLPQNTPSPYPVLIYLHGGYWKAQYDLEYAGHSCAAITATGIATWNLEYRRIGIEGGGWPGLFQDAGLGVDFLRQIAPQYNLDLQRVVVMGHSAGGHLAAWIAGRHRIPEGDPLYSPHPLPVKAAIPLAGVLDLKRAWEWKLEDNITETLMGGTPSQVWERYATASPYELLPLGVPQILLHGTADSAVPYDMSRLYYEAALAKGDNVELVTLPGTGHFEVVDPGAREWPQVLSAVAKAFS